MLVASWWKVRGEGSLEMIIFTGRCWDMMEEEVDLINLVALELLVQT